MLHVTDDHWLAGARRIESPNAGPRPDPADISLVVVHGISLPPGEFGTGCVEALFTNTLAIDAHAAFADLEGVHVSAHLLISRRGRLTQFVAFDRRAWHAGVSSYRGRQGCNDFSIGIELEGTDSTPYTKTQYARLAAVIAALAARYPKLSVSAVVGHAEIAPDRKTDPGPSFDWPRLIQAVSGERQAPRAPR